MTPTLLPLWLALAPAEAQVFPADPGPPPAEPDAPDGDDPEDDTLLDDLAAPAPPEAPPAPPIPGQQVTLVEDRVSSEVQLTYQFGARARYLSVPRGLMDLWFTDDDDLGWPLPGQDRPFVSGVATGLEFDVQKEQTRGIFYLEFVYAFLDAGYWDDRESRQPYPFVDGDWLAPRGVVGAITFGANGAHEAPIVRPSQTDHRFALSFLVGGGLGIAGILGNVDQWRFDRVDGTPAYTQVAEGDPPDKQLDWKSPIWPVPDFFLAFEFTFAERVVLRLEGGLHGGLSYGGTLGGTF